MNINININKKILQLLFIYALAYIILTIPTTLIINDMLHLMFGWNIFLAMLPLILTIGIKKGLN